MRPNIPESVVIINGILKDFFGRSIYLKTSDSLYWSLDSKFSCGETQDDKGNTCTLYWFPVSSIYADVFDRCPFYISLLLKMKANDQIESIGIKIFKEDQTSVKTTSLLPTELILRVEWDNQIDKTSKESKHAQPHWHMHSYKSVNLFENWKRDDRELIIDLMQEVAPLSILNEIQNETSPIEHTRASVTEPLDVPLYRFHLAMIAEWDKSDVSLCNKILTNSTLRIWLPQCLLYIRDQVEYILDKVGNTKRVAG